MATHPRKAVAPSLFDNPDQLQQLADDVARERGKEPPPRAFVVFYLQHGTWHATRHLEGCGVLGRAQTNVDLGVSAFPSSGKHAISGHGVLEESRYARGIAAGYPEPTDHSCVKETHGEAAS